jgi:hypothetical protein
MLVLISAPLLEAPITLVGFTALSVEIMTNLLILYLEERVASFWFQIYLPKSLHADCFL